MNFKGKCVPTGGISKNSVLCKETRYCSWSGILSTGSPGQKSFGMTPVAKRFFIRFSAAAEQGLLTAETRFAVAVIDGNRSFDFKRAFWFICDFEGALGGSGFYNGYILSVNSFYIDKIGCIVGAVTERLVF